MVSPSIPRIVIRRSKRRKRRRKRK